MVDDEEVCDTGLVLGLGHHQEKYEKKKEVNKTQTLQYDHDHQDQDLLPSLTLAPPATTLYKFPAIKVVDAHDHASSVSVVVSSFSNSSVIREKEFGIGEEEAVEEETEKVEDDHDYQERSVRKKLRLTKQQSLILEDTFKDHSTLNPKQKEVLASKLNLRPRQVEVWFQNRRARTKLKQTEVESALLKKCCEALTDENLRLKKELQDLKALKLPTTATTTTTVPIYMQLPAATITICPYCEKIISGSSAAAVNNNSSQIPFTVETKPQHFHYSHLITTNPSAAC